MMGAGLVMCGGRPLERCGRVGGTNSAVSGCVALVGNAHSTSVYTARWPLLDSHACARPTCALTAVHSTRIGFCYGDW